jgi:hypothetical protein
MRGRSRWSLVVAVGVANSGSRQSSSDQHLALVIELPCMYTADIAGLREFQDGMSESDFLLNCCGDPGVVRLRMEVSGEKDSEIVEVWGRIREAQLVETSKGYVTHEPHLTDEQLNAHGWKLMRDERACEWCQYHAPEDES